MAAQFTVPSYSHDQFSGRHVLLPPHIQLPPTQSIQQSQGRAQRQPLQYFQQQHHVQQYHAQQQQQQQHFPAQQIPLKRPHPESSGRMSNHVSAVRPLTINTSGMAQLPQRPSRPSPHTPMSIRDVQSPVLLPTPQTARPPSPNTSEQTLRHRIVSILASTANGCILELGYPTLVTKYQNLETTHAQLLESYRSLEVEHSRVKNDNFRLAEFLSARERELRQKDGQHGNIFRSLNARIAELEKERDLLKKQCHVLQEARSLDAPQAYKLLESKYHYVLEMLKRHETPISTPNRDGLVMNPPGPPQGAGSPTGEHTSATEVIDLTASEESTATTHLQREAIAPGNQGNTPQLVEGSSKGHQSSSAPSTLPRETQDATTTGRHKHIRSVSDPILTPPSLPPPTMQVIPRPVPQPLNSYTSHFANPDHQIFVNRQDQPKSLNAPSSTLQQPMSNNMITAARVAPSSGSRSTRRVDSTSGLPQMQSPSRSYSPISAQIMEVAGLTTPKLTKHSSISPAPVPVPAALEAGNQQEGNVPESHEHRPRDGTPNSAPSPPTVLTPKDQAMDTDATTGKTEAGGMEVEDQDVEMGEVQGPELGAKEMPASETPGTDKTPMPPTNTEMNIGEEGDGEEEEESYDDLTDDEGDTKQPIIDCISNIFYDDENDVRFCNFCDARYEKSNLPDPRPTFTDCSIRELIVHGKNEHEPVWKTLRRSRAVPS